MEKKIVLIQTDLVDKGLVDIHKYNRLATYLMLCEIESARMGNNLDLTKTTPSMWLPVSTLPTITYHNLFKFLAVSNIETDRYKKSIVYTIRVGADNIPDYLLFNYDPVLFDEEDMNKVFYRYIKYMVKELYGEEID